MGACGTLNASRALGALNALGALGACGTLNASRALGALNALGTRGAGRALRTCITDTGGRKDRNDNHESREA